MKVAKRKPLLLKSANCSSDKWTGTCTKFWLWATWGSLPSVLKKTSNNAIAGELIAFVTVRTPDGMHSPPMILSMAELSATCPVGQSPEALVLWMQRLKKQPHWHCPASLAHSWPLLFDSKVDSFLPLSQAISKLPEIVQQVFQVSLCVQSTAVDNYGQEYKSGPQINLQQRCQINWSIFAHQMHGPGYQTRHGANCRNSNLLC